MQTKMPLLFLSNQNELNAANAYVTTRLPGQVRPVEPALLRVSRDGHVNVNQQERLIALRSLIAWIEQADRIEDGPTERRVGTGEAIGRRDRRAVAAVEVGGGADGPGNDARTLVNAQHRPSLRISIRGPDVREMDDFDAVAPSLRCSRIEVCHSGR